MEYITELELIETHENINIKRDTLRNVLEYECFLIVQLLISLLFSNERVDHENKMINERCSR